jgi:Uncharacterized integral membrane protein
MRMSWSGHREVRKVGIMATRSSSSPPEQEPHNTPSTAEDSPPAVVAARFTRARAVWAATGVALLLLILLIVFMLQNSTKVDVHFLGMSGSIPLGMAVLIAAVGGGVVVAIAGIARVTELRMGARRRRRGTTGA